MVFVSSYPVLLVAFRWRRKKGIKSPPILCICGSAQQQSTAVVLSSLAICWHAYIAPMIQCLPTFPV